MVPSPNPSTPSWCAMPNPPSGGPPIAISRVPVSKLAFTPSGRLPPAFTWQAEQARLTPSPLNRSLPVSTTSSVKVIDARSMSFCRPSDIMKASSASSSSSVGIRKSMPSFRFSDFGKCCTTAPTANRRIEPSPGAPSPDQPIAWARPGRLLLVLVLQREVVGHAAHHAGPIEAVQVLEDQAEPAHQLGILEPLQLGIELGHEQRIASRQLPDERRIDREVVGCRMAGAAGPSVAVEGLLEEELAADFDGVCLRQDCCPLGRFSSGSPYRPASPAVALALRSPARWPGKDPAISFVCFSSTSPLNKDKRPPTTEPRSVDPGRERQSDTAACDSTRSLPVARGSPL